MSKDVEVRLYIIDTRHQKRLTNAKKNISPLNVCVCFFLNMLATIATPFRYLTNSIVRLDDLLLITVRTTCYKSLCSKNNNECRYDTKN